MAKRRARHAARACPLGGAKQEGGGAVQRKVLWAASGCSRCAALMTGRKKEKDGQTNRQKDGRKMRALLSSKCPCLRRDALVERAKHREALLGLACEHSSGSGAAVERRQQQRAVHALA